MFNGAFVEWFKSNFVSLVIAVLLALLVWVVATQEVNPAEEFTFDRPVPIDYNGMGENLIVTNDPADTVTVRVRAPRSSVRTLTLNNFEAVADLSGLGEGAHTVPINVSVVDAQALRQDYFPTEVRVELEELAEREIPVQLVLDGELPIGYQTGPLRVDPSQVTVRGPRSTVELISEVRVAVDVEQRREPLEGTLPLRVLDSEGNVLEGLEVQPPEVSVQIPVFQEADFREVAVRVNAYVQPDPGYYVSSITADPPLVPVRGDPQQLEELTSIETEPIELVGVRADQTYVAQLRPPNGVTLEDVRTVTVTVSVEAQPGFRVVEVPIQAVGLADDLTATVLPTTAVVSLRGPLPVLERLNERENIVVLVDVTGLEPGAHRLAPEAEIISSLISQEELEEVIIDSVLPTVIQVEILEADEPPEGS